MTTHKHYNRTEQDEELRRAEQELYECRQVSSVSNAERGSTTGISFTAISPPLLTPVDDGFEVFDDVGLVELLGGGG